MQTADKGFFYQCPNAPTLSAKCRYYLQAQESNYACDPRLQSSYYVTAIPLCNTYCSDWYDACASDYTCVTNWANWTADTNGAYSCPAGSPCQTFAQRFVNAEGLCNNLWGGVYTFSTDTTTWCVSGTRFALGTICTRRTHTYSLPIPTAASPSR